MIHSFLRDAGYVYIRLTAFPLLKASHLSSGDRVKKNQNRISGEQLRGFVA